MRFLIDAQLPRRLATKLREAGHDAMHTLDMPNGNRTTDSFINEISVAEQRIVITKDRDFVTTLLLSGVPYKLLLVSVGNTSNDTLESIVLPNLNSIISAFQHADFIELSRTGYFIHLLE